MSFQLDTSVFDTCCEELETLHRHWLEIGEAEEILPDLQKLQDTVKLIKNLTNFLAQESQSSEISSTQAANIRVLDPGEFFKELLGRSKKAFDPLTSKSSFSKFLMDTIKQQTNSVYSFL